MTKKITLADLEADFLNAKGTYNDSDLNYQEWVRETPIDQFVQEVEQALAEWPHVAAMITEVGVRDIYIKGMVFTIARDQSFDAALLWKIANGGAA